jgi:hypothetical protein
LIDDLRHVRLGEPFEFVTKRHIEPCLPIEAHHAVEARPVQKQEIQRARLVVKTFPNGVIEVLAAVS